MPEQALAGWVAIIYLREAPPRDAVDNIAQRKIDESVNTAKWNSRLCSVFGERHQPLALASGQDDGKDPWV